MPRVQGDGGRDYASWGPSNLDIHSMAQPIAQMPAAVPGDSAQQFHFDEQWDLADVTHPLSVQKRTSRK